MIRPSCPQEELEVPCCDIMMSCSTLGLTERKLEDGLVIKGKSRSKQRFLTLP